MVEEYYDGAGVLVESFVLGDSHVADAPRNDVPVACALNIPAGQWHGYVYGDISAAIPLSGSRGDDSGDSKFR